MRVAMKNYWNLQFFPGHLYHYYGNATVPVAGV